MIKIERNNYEQYFIDYTDGNLTPSEENQLMLFLDQNPDLKEEFEIMRENILITEEVIYWNKENLKRSSLLSDLNISNFDELCISSLEGDLNKTEENEFQNLINENSEKRNEFNLYKLTKLVSDERIVFSYKTKLKRGFSHMFLRKAYARISVAASVIVIVALYVFLQRGRINLQKEPVAQVKYEVTKKEDNQVSAVTKDVLVDKKKEIISINLKDNNNELNKVKLEEVDHNNSIKSDFKESITKISPLIVKYEFKNLDDNQLARVELYDLKDYDINHNDRQYASLKTVLAATIKKQVFNKEEKKKIELFDIAQAGIEGINKLTGSKMSLERRYDKNGMPDKTEFNSKLIAFSAPIKKD